MKVYVFDPGQTTGMAYWNLGESDKPLAFGEYKKQELFDYLNSIDTVCSDDKFIFENYRVRVNPNQQSFRHSFEEVEPCRIIGAIELRAHQLHVQTIKQEASVLKVGCGFAGIPYDSKKHVRDHLSAIAHGYYYLVKRGFIEPNGKK